MRQASGDMDPGMEVEVAPARLELLDGELVVHVLLYAGFESAGRLCCVSRRLQAHGDARRVKVEGLVLGLVGRRRDFVRSMTGFVAPSSVPFDSWQPFRRFFSVGGARQGRAQERADCCEEAVMRVLRLAQAEQWNDASTFARYAVQYCLLCGYWRAARVLLAAREGGAAVNDDDDDDDDDDDNNNSGRNDGDGGGHETADRDGDDEDDDDDDGDEDEDDPLLLPADFTELLLESVRGTEPTAVKVVLHAGAQEPQRIHAGALREAAHACALLGRAAAMAQVLASLCRVDNGMVLPELCAALATSASEGHAVLASDMAKMVDARIQMQKRLLEAETARASSLSAADREALVARRAAVERSIDDATAAFKSAIVVCAKGGCVEGGDDKVSGADTVKVLLESDMAEWAASEETYKLALRHAAMNGAKSVVDMLVETGRANADMVGDVFEDAVRRDFLLSIKVLLPVGSFGRYFLEYQREQAWLRSDEEQGANREETVVSVLDLAIAQLPLEDHEEEDADDDAKQGQSTQDSSDSNSDSDSDSNSERSDADNGDGGSSPN